jgi:hypothetical protein
MWRSVEIESGRNPSLMAGKAMRHRTLPAFEHPWVDVTRGVLLAAQAGVHVRVDVAGPKFLGDQLSEWPFGQITAEIDHDRDVGCRTHLHSALDRRPLWSVVMGGFDSDNQPWMPQRHLGGRLHLHVRQIVLEFVAAHAVSDDVEESQHTRFRSIDDARLEVLEIPPAGTARVGDSRHADPEGEAIRIDATVAGVGTWLASAGVDVRMDVDQAWRHVQP